MIIFKRAQMVEAGWELDERDDVVIATHNSGPRGSQLTLAPRGDQLVWDAPSHMENNPRVTKALAATGLVWEVQ